MYDVALFQTDADATVFCDVSHLAVYGSGNCEDGGEEDEGK